MTKPCISLHDIELLSAYLDGQLSPRQRDALEMRLRTQPSLTTELETLQKTRQMLRSLPPLRAPRNFILSPQKHGQRISTRLPSFFGAVSASSSALLIMLVIGNLIMDRAARPVSMVVDSQPSPVAMEASMPEEELAQSISPKAAGETEAAVSEDTSRIAAPTPELALVPPAAQESSLSLQPTPTPSQDGVLAMGIQETATPTPYPTVPLLEGAATTPLPYEVALPGMTVGASGGGNTMEGAVEKASDSNLPADRSPLATTFFTGEIILAGVALISGLLALVLMVRFRK